MIVATRCECRGRELETKKVRANKQNELDF
jgi:hypothetical protein